MRSWLVWIGFLYPFLVGTLTLASFKICIFSTQALKIPNPVGRKADD